MAWYRMAISHAIKGFARYRNTYQITAPSMPLKNLLDRLVWVKSVKPGWPGFGSAKAM